MLYQIHWKERKKWDLYHGDFSSLHVQQKASKVLFWKLLNNNGYVYCEDIYLNKDKRNIQKGTKVKSVIQENCNLSIYKSFLKNCGQFFISEIQSWSSALKSCKVGES